MTQEQLNFFEKIKNIELQGEVYALLPFICTLNDEEMRIFTRFKAKQLLGLLKQLDGKITFAESCTGGQLAMIFTSLPGASECMEGSVVSYSAFTKQKLAGVRQKTIDEYDPVTMMVCREMATGIKKKTDALLSIATSGFAGPTGGTKERPVGTVYVTVQYKNQRNSMRLKIYEYLKDFDRQKVRNITCAFAYAYAIRCIFNHFPLPPREISRKKLNEHNRWLKERGGI
ncbi:MAG: CinA family protein [Oscillospiraceae bacterium]|nr:CinA family protein [Oscillospiraceae bacterium]